MGVPKYIWRSNKRYYFYDTYNDWKSAYNVGRYHKSNSGSKYYILIIEKGLWFPQKVFALYLSKVQRIY